MGHRTCWARGIGIYLHASYRNAIGHKGLVIRDAKLVFPVASNFCKRVTGIWQPLLEPEVRKAELSLCVRQVETA
ncbi:Pathogeneis-related protein 1C [Fusarium oxysporum f. sp. albedinis]|nr:Pathogeneis-related protein 1C [Fusarium oxysporum f. sp. albedinis]